MHFLLRTAGTAGDSFVAMQTDEQPTSDHTVAPPLSFVDRPHDVGQKIGNAMMQRCGLRGGVTIEEGVSSSIQVGHKRTADPDHSLTSSVELEGSVVHCDVRVAPHTALRSWPAWQIFDASCTDQQPARGRFAHEQPLVPRFAQCALVGVHDGRTFRRAGPDCW